jgi:TonB family protein
MPQPNSHLSQAVRRLLSAPGSPKSPAQRQQHLMILALTLLLVALGSVLYWDRDFWFPDSEAESQTADQTEPSSTAQTSPPAVTLPSLDQKKPHSSKFNGATQHPKGSAAPAMATAVTADSDSGMTVTATRTVLPPLEVEVVAGNAHRPLPASSNSIHVDLQSGSPPTAPADPPQLAPAPAAAVTTAAAERVEMSPDAPDVVSHSVQPGYPMLARQMKVQGSVILQALIGRDGQIQQLQLVSGPPILARAAEEAVRQWHFKPHYQGAETVETQAKITVNFTISTN